MKWLLVEDKKYLLIESGFAFLNLVRLKFILIFFSTTFSDKKSQVNLVKWLMQFSC